MFRDSQTALYEAAVVTATGVSTNSYDLGVPFANGTASGAAIDPSIGHGICVALVVTSLAKVSATNETYEFDLIQSAAAGLTSPDTLVQVAFTNARAGVVLVAGAVLVIPIPAYSLTKRFIGLNSVLAGTSPTITVTAWITSISMLQEQRYYANAFVVK